MFISTRHNVVSQILLLFVMSFLVLRYHPPIGRNFVTKDVIFVESNLYF